MDELISTLKSVPEKEIIYGVLIDTYVEPLYNSKKLPSHIYTHVKNEYDVLLKWKRKKGNGNQAKEDKFQGGSEGSLSIQRQGQSAGQHKGQNKKDSTANKRQSQKLPQPSRPSVPIEYKDQPYNQHHSDPSRQVRVGSRASEGRYNNGPMNNDSQTATLETLTNKLEKYKEYKRQLEDDIDSLNRALKNAYADSNDLRSRLSKIAGDKLKINNPNITDLSDVYRPTNLGKHFSELYDNEWSDAFEEIDKQFRDERKSVDLLHDIVENAFKSCERKAMVQEEKIRDILLDIEENDSKEAADCSEVDNLHNTLIEVRKDILSRSSVNVAKNYTSREMSLRIKGYGITGPGKKLIIFARKCAELCWCMHMCDPPMSMVVCQNDKPFDKNFYREYTTSVKDLRQPIVHFVVWPPLRLNVGGPLVSKGVAQPFEKKEKR